MLDDFLLPQLDRTIPSTIITGTCTKNLRLIACIAQGIDEIMWSLLIGIREEEEKGAPRISALQEIHEVGEPH